MKMKEHMREPILKNFTKNSTVSLIQFNRFKVESDKHAINLLNPADVAFSSVHAWLHLLLLHGPIL